MPICNLIPLPLESTKPQFFCDICQRTFTPTNPKARRFCPGEPVAAPVPMNAASVAALANLPHRSPEEVTRIMLEICQPCEQFNAGKCNLCGCDLGRKIALEANHCPAGKW
jgi:hypothetical protein